MIDTNDSLWVIKVGVGGLVRTVRVRVHVERWAGPQEVDFRFQLESEQVVGSGSYRATTAEGGTNVTLAVQVQGSGQMAPMWEAMSKPLLPQLARSFAGVLKAEIEQIAGSMAPPAPSSRFAVLVRWLRRLWRALVERLAG